ncbi:hypothetical protein L208DRAFT_1540128 [Tricholoma matsutake]|nr:hypothetical protein L208DRAFT_1540128 [Tricholoma matsutake 945]
MYHPQLPLWMQRLTELSQQQATTTFSDLLDKIYGKLDNTPTLAIPVISDPLITASSSSTSSTNTTVTTAIAAAAAIPKTISIGKMVISIAAPGDVMETTFPNSTQCTADTLTMTPATAIITAAVIGVPNLPLPCMQQKASCNAKKTGVDTKNMTGGGNLEYGRNRCQWDEYEHGGWAQALGWVRAQCTVSIIS